MCCVARTVYVLVYNVGTKDKINHIKEFYNSCKADFSAEHNYCWYNPLNAANSSLINQRKESYKRKNLINDKSKNASKHLQREMIASSVVHIS